MPSTNKKSAFVIQMIIDFTHAAYCLNGASHCLNVGDYRLIKACIRFVLLLYYCVCTIGQPAGCVRHSFLGYPLTVIYATQWEPAFSELYKIHNKVCNKDTYQSIYKF